MAKSRLQSCCLCLSWRILLLSSILRGRQIYALSSIAPSTKIDGSSRPSRFPNSVPVSPSDVATLMRQTGQVNPSKAAIGVPSTCRCKYRFPQAFAMDPLYGGRINSGLLKLTCPLLVRAIDTLEDEGMIQTLSERLSLEADSAAEIRQSHERHALVRKELVSSSEHETIESKLGKVGAEAFRSAGVAGATPKSTDLKCLHAWLADALFCDEETKMGRTLRLELKARGVDLGGTSSCQKQCDPNASTRFVDPPKPRNKQRLKNRKEVERRKRRKREYQEAAIINADPLPLKSK